jgi:hypothetical protein
LEGEDRGAKEGFYPLQSDPVSQPANAFSWQAPMTPELAGDEVQSNHDASSIQNSLGYSNSPAIAEATMAAIPDGLRPGVRTGDSRPHDIPGFPIQSPNVGYSEHATEYGGEVHELDSIPGSASSPPRPPISWHDDGDKIFVSQSNPTEDPSRIQEIESAKMRLQERRQRLLELHQVDEEEERLNQQLVVLRGGTPNDAH